MIQDNNEGDTIKFFEGVAECLMNDSDTLKDVKIRAKNLAEQNAQQKIVDYIRDFLEFRYLTFPDDEILSITNEIFKISNINYALKDSGGNEMIIQSTVIAQIDDNDIMNCLVRFFNERTELKSENETLSEEIDDLKSQNESLRNEIETLSKLRAENDNLKRQMEPLRNEYKALCEKNDNLRRQTESLHAEIETLRRENDDLKRQMEPLRKENKALYAKKDNLKRKIESISTTVESIMNDEHFSSFLFYSIRGRVESLSTEIESLRKILSE